MAKVETAFSHVSPERVQCMAALLPAHFPHASALARARGGSGSGGSSGSSSSGGVASTAPALPLCWHWLLFHQAVASEQLGADGHERLGGLMPPLPQVRRVKQTVRASTDMHGYNSFERTRHVHVHERTHSHSQLQSARRSFSPRAACGPAVN